MRLILLVGLAGCRIHFDPVPDGPAVLEYTADVAECVEPSMPDPAACQSFNGSDQLVVDLMDSTTHKPWHSFVRFEIDSAIEHRTIDSIQLELTATDSVNAPGPASGEVWSVSAFDRSSLFGTEPTKIAMLAADRGPVAQLQVVDWPLPPSTVSQPGSVFLGVYPTASNGENYWNLLGRDPPRLIVNVR